HGEELDLSPYRRLFCPDNLSKPIALVVFRINKSMDRQKNEGRVMAGPLPARWSRRAAFGLRALGGRHTDHGYMVPGACYTARVQRVYSWFVRKFHHACANLKM